MISDNSLSILNFLKKNYGKEFSKEEIADALNINVKAVTGTLNTINGMVKKGYVSERVEEIEVEPATETRKAKTKVVRYETLTEAGLAYDPVAEEEARQLAIAEEKAKKKAAKAKETSVDDEDF